jgi:AP-1 complex subunit gamma-1
VPLVPCRTLACHPPPSKQASRLGALLARHKASSLLEVQSRCCEYSQLLESHAAISGQLLERMPAMEDHSGLRGSSTGGAGGPASPAAAAAVPAAAAAAAAGDDLVDLLGGLDAAAAAVGRVSGGGGASADSSASAAGVSALGGLDDLLGGVALGGGAPPAAPSAAAAAAAAPADILDLLGGGGGAPAAAAPMVSVVLMPHCLVAPGCWPRLCVLSQQLSSWVSTCCRLTARLCVSCAPCLQDELLQASGGGGAAAPSRAPAAAAGGGQVVAFDQDGLRITFDVAPTPGVPGGASVTLTSTNSGLDDLTDFNLQAAVPKFLTLRLEPASGTTVGGLGGAVTQRLHVVNSLAGQKGIAMRLRINYSRGGAPVQHQAEVSSFPPGF